MATASSLTQPSPFLQEAGEPVVLWKQWIANFQNYLLAIGGDEYSPERKRAVLLHCLGVEGQRIYTTLPRRGETPPEGTNVYNHTIQVLQEHFQPTVNVVAERYTFRQRAQQPSESIDNFLSALRDLSKTCDFGPITDEMIRDQIVEKTNSPKIRERLLMEKELTLQKAVDMARRFEKAIQEAKTLTDSNAQMHKVNKVTKRQTLYNTTKSKPASPRSQQVTPSKRTCYRCGSQAHLANDRACPAMQQECHSCHKQTWPPWMWHLGY